MLRVKNEARWIERVVSALFPFCEQVFVLDDHSTDGTPELCRAIPNVTVVDSPFTGIDESRDKNFLYEQVLTMQPDWVLHVDGDELLAPDSPAILRTLMNSTVPAWSLRVLYLWDNDQQVRTDGIYGRFYRPSFFRANPEWRWQGTRFAANFHCTNVPTEAQALAQRCDARLLHLGYMQQSDRLRKFAWYNLIDPNNQAEDGYRHMIAGDPGGPSAAEHTLHAGPLTLEAL